MSVFVKSSAGSQKTFGKCMGQGKLYKPVFLPELKGARLFSDKCEGWGQWLTLGGFAYRKAAARGGEEWGGKARGSRGGGLVPGVSHRPTHETYTTQKHLGAEEATQTPRCASTCRHGLVCTYTYLGRDMHEHADIQTHTDMYAHAYTSSVYKECRPKHSRPNPGGRERA